MAAELEIGLNPAPGAPMAARDAVAEALGDSLPPAAVADLQLIVSELVTNSVRHGPRREINLRVSIEESGLIRGEVEDHGEGTVARREMGAEGGYGLHLVDRLSDRWAVYEGSTHVWFEYSPR